MLIWHVRLIESIKVGVSWILFSVLWQKKQKTALIADCFLRRNSLRRTKSHTTQPHNLSQPWRHRPWSRADQYGIQRRFHPSPTHGMYFGSTVVRGDVIKTFYLAEIGVGWSLQVGGKKIDATSDENRRDFRRTMDTLRGNRRSPQQPIIMKLRTAL